MLGSHVIGNGAAELIHFNAHADRTAVGQVFRFLLIDLVGFDELDRERVPELIPAMEHNKNLAVAREAFDREALRVNPAHATVDRGATKLAPAAPGSLDGSVSACIEATIAPARLGLQREAALADNVSLEQVQIAPRVLVVTRQLPRSTANLDKRAVKFCIGRSLRADEVREQSSHACRSIVALLGLLLAVAAEDIKKRHQKNTLMVCFDGKPSAMRSKACSRRTSAIMLFRVC